MSDVINRHHFGQNTAAMWWPRPQLTQDAGWTYDEGELWLAASLGQLLLEQTQPRGERGGQ
ncbi:MAG TPA: hypothetical protein VEJ84_23355 [Acidimicrobiales bacterium]|nr:hypothetical protein [Acidimicrobiales bacterium]